MVREDRRESDAHRVGVAEALRRAAGVPEPGGRHVGMLRRDRPAEVDQDRAAVANEDVVRADIAVRDAPGPELAEDLEALEQERPGALRRRLGDEALEIRQRVAVDALHLAHAGGAFAQRGDRLREVVRVEQREQRVLALGELERGLLAHDRAAVLLDERDPAHERTPVHDVEDAARDDAGRRVEVRQLGQHRPVARLRDLDALLGEDAARLAEVADPREVGVDAGGRGQVDQAAGVVGRHHALVRHHVVEQRHEVVAGREDVEHLVRHAPAQEAMAPVLGHVAVVGRADVDEDVALLPGRAEHRHLALHAEVLGVGALAAPELVDPIDVERMDEQVEVGVRADGDALGERLPVPQDDVDDVLLVELPEQILDRAERVRAKLGVRLRHRLREGEEVGDRHLDAQVAIVEVDEGVLDPELGVGAMRLAKRLVEVLAQLGVGRRRVHDLARVHEEARQLEVRVRARRPVGAPLGDARLEGVDELEPVVRRELQAEVSPVQVKGLAALDDEAPVEDRLLGQLAFGERQDHLAHGLRPPSGGSAPPGS